VPWRPRVKRGDVAVVADVLTEIDVVQRRVEELLDGGRTPLAAEPDLATIEEWCVQAHRRHLGWN
jgi:uncharacterized protein